MLLSSAPSKLTLPFANAGGKNTIPVASQIGITAGAASLTDGFPPLTRTPVAAGGVPPSGLDMNGIMYAISALSRWYASGGAFKYDSTFANDTNIGGYPAGARVLRSDGTGYWLNTIDGNTVDPESVTVNQAQLAGWVPDLVNGIASIAMSGSNVTMTPAQYGKPVIIITGTLTANVNLIFPNMAGEWTVINNATGTFTVTCKTAAGTGLALSTGGHSRIVYGDGTNIYSAKNSTDTQAQFDNSTYLANTAFVQRALGGLAGYSAVSTTQALTAAFAGNLITIATSSSITLTLPAASSFPAGASLYFAHVGGNGAAASTIARAGADLIYTNGATVTSLSINYGDTLTLVSSGSAWVVANGSLALGSSASFAANLGTNGYQKLPGGLIIQWGQATGSASADVTVTLPIAYPTSNRCVLVTPINGSGSTTTVAMVGATTSSNFAFGTRTSTTGSRIAEVVSWLTIGN